MSELFDDDPRATPPPRQAAPRRSRALLITAVVVIVAIFALTGFSSIYTDRLWYQSVGYGGVFSTLLWTRIGLFLVFGAVLGGIVALNIYLAYRFRPLFRPNSREQTNLDRYRDVVTPIRVWVVLGVALVVGAFAGASGMSHWRTYLLWRNGGSFDQDDPYFNRDIGFYVFDLPWLHFIVDFSMAIFVMAIIAALVTHYLYGGIRLQSAPDRLSPAAQAQLSVLLGLFVLAKGVDYYLDRFDLVNQKNSLFTGMNYTAENAVLPAKNILMGVAVICAILFFLNVWRRTWQLPSVGLALLVLSAILLGMIWPAIVQQFQVKPSEADKEEPYIARNIEATQAAYDLQDVETTPFSPNTSLDATRGRRSAPLLSSVPLVDPKQVSPAFENIQQERGYYSVPEVLDVDRYEIDGSDRAMVLGVRELDQDGLSPDARNWSNLHTVFTHGNGIIAAYANQRDAENAVTSDTGADAPRPRAGSSGRRASTPPRPTSPPSSAPSRAASTTASRAPTTRWSASRRSGRGRRAQPAGARLRPRHDHDLRRPRRRLGRQHVQPADVRDQVRRAQLPALGPRQRQLQGALRPRPQDARREGRPVADRRQRRLPGGRRRTRSRGSSTATPRPTATRTPSASRSRT